MKKSAKKNLVLKVLSAVLVLSMLISFGGCSNNEKPGGSDIEISKVEDESKPDVVPGEVTINPDDLDENGEIITGKKDDVKIETPYCDLWFPGDWAGFLKTEIIESPVYSVKFSAELESGKVQELFTVYFGGETGSLLGVIKGSSGETEVRVDIPEFVPDGSWSASDINIVFSMQEEVNYIIDKLPLKGTEQPSGGNDNAPDNSQGGNVGTTDKPQGGNSSSGGPAELPPEAGDMTIDVPGAELHYPARWAEYLDIKVTEKNGAQVVEFFCKAGSHSPERLFTVYVGGTEGSYVSSVTNVKGEKTEIRLGVEELSLDGSWSDIESDIAYAMQEDLNYLISELD